MNRAMKQQFERFPDPNDASRHNEEMKLNDELNRIRAQAKKREAAPKGFCLNCETKFKKSVDKRWCDAECRDEWQEYQDKMKHR